MFFSPLIIGITSLGDESANLSAFRRGEVGVVAGLGAFRRFV